ncbi:MAG: YfhO family protein [Paludisphaera borealis]|uniref:YfhO family protein n=1 Tax=Paludisphaera borealis TaxID=1387353 RepID=UPI0028436272|nr:YfhO family protein [Paludisphaera borealis]MDR3621108.1 YfhO family protein [Paludisphaera borealis]
MQRRTETIGFGVVLAACVTIFFHEALLTARVLSPADVLLVEASFREPGDDDYQPFNRLLMDPVLQFQPWLAFNRAEIRHGRLPLWNPHAGCGTPHLANGQSAVFDPFQLLIYLGPWPDALAWVAAARLWFAGLGAFLLARSWGMAAAGRWFAGLIYPFCGFLVVWLLYPVTPAAIWLPWILLATDRATQRPSVRSSALLALCVGSVVAAGHIQTSAHVLLAAGGLAAWRLVELPRPGVNRWRCGLAWSFGIVLGLGIAAVQILPLGVYLSKSPVWSERRREHPPWWVLSKPRLLESACTGLPYLYGSQRRGHPNLARGLGLNNLNESAGGYAGLATLVWLVPLGLRARRGSREATFLAAMLAVGALGAFRLPPVDNILRALPVLNVTDNRRLTLWVAFALTMLGGFGIDRLARGDFLPRGWLWAWLAAAGVLGVGAVLAPMAEPMLRARAERHYQNAPGAALDSTKAASRAERQVRAALDFVPRRLGLAAVEFLAFAGLAVGARRSARLGRALPASLIVLTVVELFDFGIGLNPTVDRATQDRIPPVIARLREGMRPGDRALGVEEELPPNVLMRYGLADPRNYDSVELTRSLDWLDALYEPTDEARSSRRTVSWRTVEQALPRLKESAVVAVVAASPPPNPGLFERVERVGDAWIGWLDARDWADASPGGPPLSSIRPGAGTIRIEVPAGAVGPLVARETWDPGWTAKVDGSPVKVERYRDAFMQIPMRSESHIIELTYDPMEVRWGLAASSSALVLTILGLTGSAWSRICGIARRGLGRTRARRLESS